jgi:hypothetical protein
LGYAGVRVVSRTKGAHSMYALTPGQSYMSPNRVISRIIFVLMLLLSVTIAGCNGPSANDRGATATPAIAKVAVITPVASTPTEVAAPGWTREPTPALMDQVWQPPEPKKRIKMSTPTAMADSPDVMLVYDLVGLAMGQQIKVTQKGEVVLGGYQGTSVTYQLSPAEFDRIKQQVAATDFFNLADRYWVEDPPGVIAEIPIVTITYKEGGRTKSVSLRGSEKTPPALRELEDTLSDLGERAGKEGTPTTKPDSLVGYYLQGTDFVWWLDVDIEGGLYYGSGPAEARLPADELKALEEALGQISGLSSDEWFLPTSDVRNTLFMSEHRAIITTYRGGQQWQWINAISGATVPDGLQAVLEKLAEIYDKYAPGQ